MPFGKSSKGAFDLEEPEPLDEPPAKKKPPAKKTTTTSVSVAKKPPMGAGLSEPPYRSAASPNGAAGYMDGSDTEGSDIFGGGGMGQMGAAAMGGGEEGGGDYGEDFGQKLAADIDSVIAAHGLEKSEGRGLAANLFGAISDCLARAAGGGGAEPEAAAVETTEVEEEPEEEEA